MTSTADFEKVENGGVEALSTPGKNDGPLVSGYKQEESTSANGSMKRDSFHREDSELPTTKRAKTQNHREGDNDATDDLPGAPSQDAPPNQRRDLKSDSNINDDANDSKPPALEEQPDPSPAGAPGEQAPSTPNSQPIDDHGEQHHSQQLMQHQAQHHQLGGYQPMMGGMMHPQYQMMHPYAHYSHPHVYPGQPMMVQHLGMNSQGTHSPNPGQQAQQPVPSHMPSQAQPYAMYDQSQQPNEGSPSNNNGRAPPFSNHYAGMMAAPMHMVPHYGPPAGMFFGHYPSMPGTTAMLNPMMSYNGSGAPPGINKLAHIQAPPPRMAGIPLSLSCDDEQLSEYQMLVRKQLEIFEALPEDVESNTQGRKKQVILGQVGIRCRHCSGLPLRQRGRGAVYYPARLQGVYQAAQNMASSHLCESCQCIPPQLKHELRSLRDRRDTASGGKQYWADGARAMGLIETEEGLRLRRPEGTKAPPSPS